MKKIIKTALPYTIPVCMGYIFLGIAFGILMVSKGFHPGWAILMSVIIYAGSMQFVTINLLSGPFAPLTAALVTLMVNARHIFYGLSMLDHFKVCDKLKPYMIFSLTDETYSILCSVDPPEGIDKKWFMFFVSLFDHFYWITGSAIGALAGSLIKFDTTGIDFAMTALFIVIFVEQWESTKNHIPAIFGVVLTALCLLIFGQDWFIIASMVFILLYLTGHRKMIEKRMGDKA